MALRSWRGWCRHLSAAHPGHWLRIGADEGGHGSVQAVVAPERLRQDAALGGESRERLEGAARAKDCLNGIDPVDVTSYRYEQGYTFELNLSGTVTLLDRLCLRRTGCADKRMTPEEAWLFEDGMTIDRRLGLATQADEARARHARERAE